MNRKAYKGKTKYLLSLILPVLMLASCVLSDEQPEPGESRGGAIDFTLNMPASTRSLDGTDENEVREIDVVVFQNSGNGGKFQSRKTVYAAAITPGGVNENQKSFSVELLQGSYDLVIFANAGDALDAAALNGKTKAALLAALTELLPANGKWVADKSAPGYRPFPMWGDVGVIEITPSTSLTGTSSVTMTRMMSRVDIGVSASNFQLVSIDVYNYNTEGYVAPFASSWNATGKIATAPSVPAGVRLLGPVTYSGTAINTTNNECVQEIYIFEAENLTGSAAKESSDRTCLVVGGVFDANADGDFTNDSGTTYYRVDFSTGSGAAESFLDVLRNHKYSVNIQSVEDDGYDTSLNAFKGGARLTAEITPWNLANQSVIGDGQYWLTTSRDDLVFDFRGDTEIVVAETNYNIIEQGFPKGVVVDEAEITYIPSVAPGEEWLSLSDSGTDGALKRIIDITAAQNLETGDRSAKIRIKAGNFTKVINVVQYGVEFTFSFIGAGVYIPYTGGTQPIQPKSYATAKLVDGNVSSFPIPWTVDFSENLGSTWSDTPPSWVIAAPAGGPGSLDYSEEYYFTAEARKEDDGTITNTEDLALRAATVRGTQGAPYDLSTIGGTAPMNTANCYIVNAGGHYKLPLVYGNAVKNGTDNPSAYSSTAAAESSTFLRTFRRHDDQPITGPFIYEQFTPGDATLVWMDMIELVTNVRLADNGTYLAFDVPQSRIAQGNAIVAVRDAGGNIMWSWHIWVTPLVDMDSPATDETTNYQGTTRQFMQYNLGWCTARSAINYGAGANRYVRIRLTQGTSGLERIFDLVQAPGTVAATGGNAPYWQWGRKDPMLPSGGITGSDDNKAQYYAEGYSFTKTQGSVTIGTAIQNPNRFYLTDGSSYWISSGTYANLWDVNATTTSYRDGVATKTVYDPSPAGFVMPAAYAWTGFVTTGTNSNLLSDFRVSGPFDAGWSFYTIWGSTSTTAFYPAAGFRYAAVGGLWVVNKEGHYWSCSPASDNSIYSFHMYFRQIDTDNQLYAYSVASKSEGYSVRCCTE